MNRNTLRQLERSVRTANDPNAVYDRLRQRARQARPDDDPDEIDARLRLSLALSAPRYEQQR